ncbi:MAG: type VI secretion system contractile sheath small subunit [Acidobacteriia bacterium]|nr:type VI secretion system contractile sheath small subunit [Terriglobia bacterium]
MATKASITKKLGRVRPPRVHITYDVETGGAWEKREIPFVVGVLADLSADSNKNLPKVRERKFIEIDRDNFDDVLAKQQPRIAFKVDNKLSTERGRMGVELNFKKLDDFEPQNVARQVEPLKQLLDLRTKLSNLRSSVTSNDRLGELLQDAVTETESLRGKAAEPESSGESEEEKG